MDMKTLGIGMVGARWGARMHHSNYRYLPPGLVEIRGVCSRSRIDDHSYLSKTLAITSRRQISLRCFL
jgi:hypothetical protein